VDAQSHQSRIKQLRAKMDDAGHGALLVMSLVNIRYLTGFTGSAAAVLVTQAETFIISDFRYRLQASREVRAAEFVEVEKTVGQTVARLLGTGDISLAAEANHMNVVEWSRLQSEMGDIQVLRSEGMVESLRARKDEEEIRRVRESAKLLKEAFCHLEEMQVVGRTERDVALDLEVWVRRNGSDPVPFPYIVAFGTNGAMPHATASQKIIAGSGLLVVDIGTSMEGYCADMTRTYGVGELSDEAEGIYEVVRRAQETGLQAAKAGLPAIEMDKAARTVIEDAGMGEYYKHGLGHGVGLEVHEAPRIGSRSIDVLEADMVFTVEPGVYRSEIGGVRIEDTVVLRSEGLEVLTVHPHELRTLE